MRGSQGTPPISEVIHCSKKTAWQLVSGQKCYLDTWVEKAQRRWLILCQIFKESKEKLKVKQQKVSKVDLNQTAFA